MTSNQRQYRCCDDVKEAMFKNHRKCSTKKTTGDYAGRKINSYYGIDTLKDDEKYTVCYNIHFMLRNFSCPRLPRKRKSKIDVNVRFSKRLKNIAATPSFIHTVKKVIIKVKNTSTSIFLNDLDENKQTQVEPLNRYDRKDRKSTIQSKINKYGYKTSYKKLENIIKKRRVNKITCMLLASCLSKDERKKDNWVSDFLLNNKLIVCDVLAIIDDIRLKLQNITKVNLSSLTEEDKLASLTEEDMLPSPMEYKTSAIASFASIILSESSQSGYTRMRKALVEQHNVSENELPTYYKIAKNRPKIESFSVKPDDCDPWFRNTIPNVDCNINDTTLNETTALQPLYTPSSFINTDIDIKDAYEKIKASEIKSEVLGAKITGSYKDYCTLMIGKHKDMNPEVKGKIIVLDSYDGANHKRDSSVISFSSQMTSSTIVKNTVGAGSSLNILTWMQLEAAEKAANLFPVIKSIYKEKHELREKQAELETEVKYCFQDVHDGKMAYSLTQHSLFNRKYNPFLLCSCNRGDGVKNVDHVCKILTEKEQRDLWNRSLRRWNNKTARDATYKYFEHMDYVDQHNLGVSHFGIHPDHLPRNSIRFDVFHLRCAITRRLMSTLRKFIICQKVEVVQKFSDKILSTFWNKYKVLIWNLNKPFACFLGTELLAFIRNIVKIETFLRDTFLPTPRLNALCDSLILWHKITPFLVIHQIKDENKYKEKMLAFNENLQKFYIAGKYTFLTKNAVSIGGDETFYLHCLKFYLPPIAKSTFEEHGLGLGIYTMQGFERRNKESKNVMNRFSNGVGNIVVSNLKRLWDVFNDNKNKI